MSLRTIRRALLSVSDKTGLVEFAKLLTGFGVELVSTGGTGKALFDAGLNALDISEITGFPEMLDGRVKTLHPRVHGGILYIRDNSKHETTIREHKIVPIDMVVCNLYPFEAVAAKPTSGHEEIIENIDIGGPSMVRSASKNYRDVAIVTDPGQYDAIAQELKENAGALSLPTRERLAGAAFALTAGYDAAIAGYFAKKLGDDTPARLSLSFQHKQKLRYGENPHQAAAFYAEPNVKHACVAAAEVLHGKELSYNNILDLDSALNLVREFAEPAVVVIKHNNPCGAATSANLVEAFARAYEGDPVSAYGGILGFNREVDEATAMQITEPNRFIECIIAPAYSKAAFEILTTRPKWKASVRLLRTGALTDDPARSLDFRRVDGGLLVQTRDGAILPSPSGRGAGGEGDDFVNAKVVTKHQPTDAELADLKFTWLVAKHVKSNAIVLGKDRMIVGVGAGQMSRIDSTHMAVRKAGERSKGSVLASDAFFPFRDNVDEAAKAGVAAIVAPGGSVRDQESIDACNEHGIAMIFTGVRHFRH
jgi:phosphoribosylaminoimidazolecarboxamide formyltransferase / IMP cyclohydrolase